MSVKLQHIAIAVLTAVLFFVGQAFVQLNAGIFQTPADYLMSMVIGLGNAVGVALVQAMINEGFRFEFATPSTGVQPVAPAAPAAPAPAPQENANG